jgi:hypothetical protein
MKVSIIGAAQIVKQYHLHALNAIQGVRIKSIVDLDYDEAYNLAQNFGANASTDYGDVKGSDLVLIATPPGPRAEIIRRLPLDIKKVVVEKPVGFDMNDLDELVAICEDREIEIYVAQTRRYFLNLRLCSELIRDGLLGGIKEIQIFEGGIFNWLSNSEHLSESLNPKDKGVLQDVGSHIFDWLGMTLVIMGLSPHQFELSKCVADYNQLSNFINTEFRGPFNIKCKISRSNYLSNTIKITGEKGVLITRSLLDDKIKVINDNSFYWIKTEFSLSDYSLETAFISMWKDLLFGDKNSSGFPTLVSVRAGMKFIDETLNQIEK